MTSERTFGQLLRDLRIGVGLKQTEVAREVGVSQGQVSHWERDAARPDDNQILMLSVAFSTSYYELMDARYGFSTPVERAIVADKKLTPKEQDAILAHYGVASGRDSLQHGQRLRERDR